MTDGLSRRALIALVGRAGGADAAYRVMAAMGLLAVPEAYAGPPKLPPPRAGGRVLVLGAGIAGMVAAWELSRAGYDVRVLEARARTGGRNWSLRAGDAFEETDNPPQFVRWTVGEHMYFNPGPARIPTQHEAILSYCRDLGVRLEIMCNESHAALMQDDAAFGGVPQRARAVVADMRGHIAALAAKALDKDALAAPVDADDLERLRAMLLRFGALDQDLVYRGSSRAGWQVPPGGGTEAGTPLQPLDLRQIVRSAFWQGPTQFSEFYLQSPAMMQPVGGMGVIGQTFGRHLMPLINRSAEVTAIRRAGNGARVEWRDVTDGATHADEADIVLCTLPLPALAKLTETGATDFAPATRAAVTACDYVPAGKVAFEATRRFWEEDAGIYGGISWINRDSTQVWYPTAGLQQRRGVLLGAYIWSERIGTEFAARTHAERLSRTLADIEVLHPGASAMLDNGISIAWPRIPYSHGAWADWSEEARATHYKVLLAGDGPVLFAGEHMSFINGWQEGAVRSAHVALTQIAERLRDAG